MTSGDLIIHERHASLKRFGEILVKITDGYDDDMRSPTYSPTVRRRRLGMELRRFRETVGLTGTEAATLAGMSRAALGKIETAETRKVPLRQVDALIKAYDISPDQGEALRQLARDAGERGWWWRYRDIFGSGSLPDFEAEAELIQTYEIATVPGLLQTPEYARALFRGGPLTAQEHIDHQVDARMTRQEILHRHDRAPRLWAVIDEAALRRPIGGAEVMRGQLDYLVRIGQSANIDIQVLPLAVGAHPGLGVAFTVLHFAEPLDPTIVYTDSIGSGLFEEDPDAVAQYSATFSHVQAAASNTVVSAQFIEGIRDESD
ncbi:helix-turn-helix transcriptional regulator [Nocardiopsis tropica]|uniref:Helix-turn-helix transcriptional regulator n=1 Tax=Nocardiopsis tropica TaxID=109330 RepID=A0ABU7KX23_9ACTN|nr:helix-turn-helix transcriptional regulator [Nocardiopsis umidischolae]MEE2053852.1 helix-turn-helix transcriptional regulator [Nocardiopsis umidischolae]